MNNGNKIGKMFTIPADAPITVIRDANNVNAPAPDPVNAPAHYTFGKFETIDIIKDKLTPEQFEGFCIGNVIKYITRYQHKNGLEDLEKGLWYLNCIIAAKKQNPDDK